MLHSQATVGTGAAFRYTPENTPFERGVFRGLQR